MKLLSILSFMLLLTSCQDALRTRRPINGPKLDAFTAESNQDTVQVTVDFATDRNKFEILTNSESGDEGCAISLTAGTVFTFKATKTNLTIFNSQGDKSVYERISPEASGLLGNWKRVRQTNLMEIEERMFFDKDERLIVRLKCKQI